MAEKTTAAMTKNANAARTIRIPEACECVAVIMAVIWLAKARTGSVCVRAFALNLS